MNTAIQNARGVYNILSDIQPAVSMSGLDTEADMLKTARANLALLISELTPAHPNIEKVVASCRIDAISTFMALRSQLMVAEFGDDLSDEYLQMAKLSAEMFVVRCQDYLSSRESLNAQIGG